MQLLSLLSRAAEYEQKFANLKHCFDSKINRNRDLGTSTVERVRGDPTL